MPMAAAMPSRGSPKAIVKRQRAADSSSPCVAKRPTTAWTYRFPAHEARELVSETAASSRSAATSAPACNLGTECEADCPPVESLPPLPAPYVECNECLETFNKHHCLSFNRSGQGQRWRCRICSEVFHGLRELARRSERVRNLCNLLDEPCFFQLDLFAIVDKPDRAAFPLCSKSVFFCAKVKQRLPRQIDSRWCTTSSLLRKSPQRARDEGLRYHPR